MNPPMNRRNVEIVVKTRGVSSLWDEPAGSLMTGRAVTGVEGGANRMHALPRNCRNQSLRWKGEAQAEKTARRDYRRGALGPTDPYWRRRLVMGAGAKGSDQEGWAPAQPTTGGRR